MFFKQLDRVDPHFGAQHSYVGSVSISYGQLPKEGYVQEASGADLATHIWASSKVARVVGGSDCPLLQ